VQTISWYMSVDTGQEYFGVVALMLLFVSFQ
jgi:hypothetical protein